MKKIFSLILALAMILTLAACGQEVPQEGSNGQVTLNVYNWGQYIADGTDDSMDIVAAFEKAYPWIDVNYATFDSNEIMYSKLSNGGITVDVIFPSDYMVARLIDEDMIR